LKINHKIESQVNLTENLNFIENLNIEHYTLYTST